MNLMKTESIFYQVYLNFLILNILSSLQCKKLFFYYVEK